MSRVCPKNNGNAEILGWTMFVQVPVLSEVSDILIVSTAAVKLSTNMREHFRGHESWQKQRGPSGQDSVMNSYSRKMYKLERMGGEGENRSVFGEKVIGVLFPKWARPSLLWGTVRPNRGGTRHISGGWSNGVEK